MPSRVWYRSLDRRIAIGYIALLAVLVLVQTSLFVWLTNRMWGRASRTPAQLAQLVAQDLQTELTQTPDLELEPYLRQRYGRGYQPFIVALASGLTISNRQTAVPQNLARDARIRLHGGDPERNRGLPGQHTHYAEYSDIVVDGLRTGVVAVAEFPPPLNVNLRELAPTLTWVGIGLLSAGAAVMALLIFRPTHRRLRSLEEAARALGDGRTDVRANESGGDEVSALSRTFNKMAEDLQTRAAALAESDGARRRLLADVSHELMTPLSAIRGYVETLAMPEVHLDEATQRRYLDIAHQETHKLEAIIGDLLDLARLEGGGETFDCDAVLVDDLFRRVSDRHRPARMERGVRLDADIASGTPLVWGDAERLEQALQNVAANAIRHTPEGGLVTLRAAGVDDRVRITVSDTGPGIPPEHLPHIFDRFFKADAARAGTRVSSGSGLGLSIVGAIIARHGGEVRASNLPEGGAMFEILLPTARSHSGAAQA